MNYIFHKLIPVKEIEPGWFKLKWKAIKNGTYNFYIDKPYRFKSSRKMFGFSFRTSSAHNGWGRSWDGFALEIGLYFIIINFWIHYNLICKAEGPGDVPEFDKKPLDFSKSKLKVN